MRLQKKIIFVLSALCAAMLPLFVLAQAKISVSIPGPNPPSTSNPCAYVINAYWFALFISGILAFGAIVWGGIKYALAAGNPSGQSEGKQWISGALIGVLLLAGTYLVLYTINPALTKCSIGGLSQLTSTPPGGGGGGGGTAPNGSGSYASLAAAGFACKPASQQPNGQSSCSADPKMIATLQCIQKATGNDFTVTEGMPPTVAHLSHCHNDGCCVDVKLNSGTCADVQAVVAAAQKCGTTAANEYPNCSGTIYSTSVGSGNVHINAGTCR